MTAEPDALRLVPAKATRKQLEDAAFNLSAEIGSDEALKLAPHIERAYELLVAAAPAVQPAAGRPFAWAYRYPSDPTWQITRDETQARDKTGEVQPLYAHPPAQGSESVGQSLNAAVFGLQTIAEDTSLVTLEQMRAVAAGAILNAFGAKGSPGGMAEALRPKSDENRLHLFPQPGPASEGDPAHD